MTNKIKFTTTAVDKLRFPKGAVSRTGTPLNHFVYWDTELRSLGVRLSANSPTKTYLVQHRVRGGAERSVSIGRHRDPMLLPDGKLRSFPVALQINLDKMPWLTRETFTAQAASFSRC